MQDAHYDQLKRTIARLLTIDIDAYKTEQMRRRIETFITTHGGGTEALLGGEVEGYKPLGGNFYQRPLDDLAGRRVA